MQTWITCVWKPRSALSAYTYARLCRVRTYVLSASDVLDSASHGPLYTRVYSVNNKWGSRHQPPSVGHISCRYKDHNEVAFKYTDSCRTCTTISAATAHNWSDDFAQHKWLHTRLRMRAHSAEPIRPSGRQRTGGEMFRKRTESCARHFQAAAGYWLSTESRFYNFVSWMNEVPMSLYMSSTKIARITIVCVQYDIKGNRFLSSIITNLFL